MTRMSSSSSPAPEPVVRDVPRWARVVDRLTVVALVVLAAILVFGPLRIMAGNGLVTLSSPLRAAVVLIVLASVRHYFLPRPHLGRRLWNGARAVIASSAWRSAAASFFAFRLSVLFIGSLAVVLLGFPEASKKIPVVKMVDNGFLNLPVRWDAGWYLRVALDGYDYNPADRGQQNIAFFPGYPAMMRVGGALLGARAQEGNLREVTYADIVRRQKERTVLAGWLIALAAGFWGMAKLFTFARECGASPERAGWVVMLASAYPFAFFYGAIYTEPIFLVASVATFASFVRRDYVTAACWGVLVGLVRPNGCFVSIPLAIIATQQAFFPSTLRLGDGTPMSGGWRTWTQAMLAASVPGLAMLAFTGWLYMFTGVPFAWLEAHKAWGRQFGGFGMLVKTHWGILQGAGPLGYVVRQPIDLINALGVSFAIAMAIPVARKLGIAYAVFLLINAVPPLLAGGFLSLGRVTSTLFPMFICLGLWLRPTSLAWVLGIWGMAQGLLAALFYSWRPIF